MAEAAKDTIYIDIDDDITSIIDKVTQSKNKIVALVLPKRASALQSIVNMKLLKRSGDSNKKKLVLITSESGLLPLAGAVGLHVAKTLQSKPLIPAAPNVPSHEVEAEDAIDDAIKEDDSDLDADAKLDSAKPVGELAAASKASSQAPEETIELDDEPEEVEEAKSDKKSTKNDKKLKIPNFNSFRKKILIGGVAFVGLIVFWYFANFVMPTANVVITTDNVSVTAEVTLTADTGAEAFDAEKGLVPATEVSVKKTDTEKVPATGKKNVGEKATGTVSLQLTNCSDVSVTVPAGTGVSNNGLTYITQASATFYSILIGGSCQNSTRPDLTTATINVVAQNSGDEYNISENRKFTVSGFSNVTGFTSSSMSGGTDKQVKVVSKEDIESASEKLKDKSLSAATEELKKKIIDQGLYPIVETLTSGSSKVSSSPKVGKEADEATVSSDVTYKMLGVKRDDLKTLIVDNANEKIDTSKQKISDDGLDGDNAVIKVTNQDDNQRQNITIQSNVGTGAQEDQDAIKQEISGKKKGQAEQLLKARPGVTEVNVNLSPFWVSSVPGKASKITIEFKQVQNQ